MAALIRSSHKQMTQTLTNPTRKILYEASTFAEPAKQDRDADLRKPQMQSTPSSYL